jgi:catechol 2,3-dioxygenase-like lactoylglutathione lyase family enzyme
MASSKEIPLAYGGHGMPGRGAVEPIDGFSHLVLEVSDLDRSERWYAEVIGLDRVGRDVLAEPRPHSVLRLNSGQLVVLIEIENPEPRRKNSSSIHHAVESFRARGEFSMDIYDPDDHRWQVQTYTDEAHAEIRSGLGVVDCGPAEQFGEGSVTTFGKDGSNFFLVRDGDGLVAISRWCRHMNGLLTYQPEHWRFYCAFHGATYNLEGEHTGHLPNIPPLKLHPIRLSDEGHVLVDTDVFIERSAI